MAEIGRAVAGKVVDSLFVVAKKEIGYMWNCTEHVEKLKNEVEKLKEMGRRVLQQIDIAKDIGDNLLFGVEHWVVEADEKISKAHEFLQQEAKNKKTCFKLGMCGNWATLHRYGKKATKMTLSLLEHRERGMVYESCVSVYTPAPGPLDVYQNKDLDDIHTHNSALRDIVKSLEDDSIQIIGIYGLGGVGKTTLAKEVVARVKNTLFAHVAFTIVSQNVDVEKIQKDIREATKRIVEGDKILIILDDVWEKLNLEELCIPCGSNYKNCKILLTSRNEDVCEKMNAQSKICVESLPTTEAWILFKRVVGERLETDADLKPVAKKIVEQCGGLPLLIQAVGNALKHKNIDLWERSLKQLRDQLAFPLLTYGYLSEEANLCLQLCSMFPKETHIHLEYLTYYAVGLQKFKNLKSMEDARNRVRSAVNILKASSLLLNGDNEYTTKMPDDVHDDVHDEALLLTSRVVLAGKGVTENVLENCTSEARVLDMEYCNMNLSSLPPKFDDLTELRMLNLGGIKSLQEIDKIGVLKNLEILIVNSTGIKVIPQEMGLLVKLKRLDVSGCLDLSRIEPGVILKLERLEELCIGFYQMQEGNILNSLDEIMKLSKLTYLDLFVPFLKVIPQGFAKLKGFFIQIEGREHFSTTRHFLDSKRYLILRMRVLDQIQLRELAMRLIEVNSHVILQSLENLNNILPSLDHEVINKLESIELDECPNVTCLVGTRDSDQVQSFHSSKDLGEGKTKEKFFTELKHLHLSWLFRLEVLWKCPGQYISLSNLVTFSIVSCHMIERLFSVSVAQGLVKLQKLHIGYSIALKEVICDGDEETDRGESETGEHATNIMFPCLVEISFENLPMLKSFYSGSSAFEYPSLAKVNISCCTSMKIWSRKIRAIPRLKCVGDVPLDDGAYTINDAVAKIYENDQATNLS